MKKKLLLLVVTLFCTSMIYSQETIDQIILYKISDISVVSSSLTGTGMNGFKLYVNDEILIMAKAVNTEGKEVTIWPTWKADKELAISVVEGKSKIIKVKAMKKGVPLFITAIYIDDTGKKYTGEVMGEVKEKTE